MIRFFYYKKNGIQAFQCISTIDKDLKKDSMLNTPVRIGSFNFTEFDRNNTLYLNGRFRDRDFKIISPNKNMEYHIKTLNDINKGIINV